MKCECGHSQKSHLSHKYGNMPRQYGECRKCDCKQFEESKRLSKKELIVEIQKRITTEYWKDFFYRHDYFRFKNAVQADPEIEKEATELLKREFQKILGFLGEK